MTKRQLSRRQTRRVLGVAAFLFSLALAAFGVLWVIPMGGKLFGCIWIGLALIFGAADLFYAFNKKFESEEIKAEGSRTPGRMELAAAFDELEARLKSGEIDEEKYQALRRELLKRL